MIVLCLSNKLRCITKKQKFKGTLLNISSSIAYARAIMLKLITRQMNNSTITLALIL